MTCRRRPGCTRGLAVAGRQPSPRPSDASPTAPRLPRTAPSDRPPAVPAVSRCRARQHHGQAATIAPGAPGIVRMSQRRGRTDAHCPSWPLQPQRFFGAPLPLETCASSAGLAARARHQRPDPIGARRTSIRTGRGWLTSGGAKAGFRGVELMSLRAIIASRLSSQPVRGSGQLLHAPARPRRCTWPPGKVPVLRGR